MRLFGRRRILIIQKKKIKLYSIVLVSVITFAFFSNYVADIFFRNMNEYIENYLDVYTQRALNKAIVEITDMYDLNVSNFVRITTSAAGQTAYLETDTIKINDFRAKISNKILDNLSQISKTNVEFKIFNFFGNTLLMNRGPSVAVTIFPLGSAVSDISSKFSSSGVNQTMHELIMTVEINARVVFPLGSVKRNGKASVPIANTVIVGEVPDSYVNVTTDDENLKNDVLQLATE